MPNLQKKTATRNVHISILIRDKLAHKIFNLRANEQGRMVK